MRHLLLVSGLVLPDLAAALELTLPNNAEMTREANRPADSYLLPVGPHREDFLPVLEIEGRIRQQAWRLGGGGLTTLQMIRPLRQQAEAAGYDLLYECSSQECGGFDFRFNTELLPAPDMYVDLFDFRYLAARRGAPGTGAHYLSIMVSRVGQTGYAQITEVLPEKDMAGQDTGDGVSTAAPEKEDPVSEQLETNGHVVLADLDFATGSTDLGEGPYASLETLAAFLLRDPSRRVALVGHTDTVGPLETNISVSRKRARSVMRRLVAAHDVPAAQLEAEGMGYLSPIATNLTETGRDRNRRVEAVLLNTE